MKTGKDQPLVARIEDDQLVIRIGIDTLAHAAAHCERFWTEEEPKYHGGPWLTITDNDEFAKDVVRALQDEDPDDGSGPLSELFDAAAERAVNDGSLAVKWEE